MTTAGVLFMSISIASVLALLVSCYWRILRQPR